MRKFLLACTALVALSVPASADVLLDTTGLGGTGNNVVFTGIDPLNSRLILGHLNGQNNEVVRFFDVSNTTGFSGAANGQDIKIVNTRDLDITVFDSTNTIQLGTTRDIFSLKGTGDVFFRVSAVKADGTAETFNFTGLAGNVAGLGGGGYDLGNGNQQNGFDFSVANGEVITDIDLFLKVGGMINDFEHFRIDATPIPTAAVPEASTWAMMIAGFLGVGALSMRKRRREGGAAFRLA
jgi:hypothetical protein